MTSLSVFAVTPSAAWKIISNPLDKSILDIFFVVSFNLLLMYVNLSSELDKYDEVIFLPTSSPSIAMYILTPN
ncbi:hypothetical protein CH1034_250039 [Klebsiella pneumoniae]|nr:hypothetical protein CH1034_250039 [Klebsiella pneumoniae]